MSVRTFFSKFNRAGFLAKKCVIDNLGFFFNWIQAVWMRCDVHRRHVGLIKIMDFCPSTCWTRTMRTFIWWTKIRWILRNAMTARTHALLGLYFPLLCWGGTHIFEMIYHPVIHSRTISHNVLWQSKTNRKRIKKQIFKMNYLWMSFVVVVVVCVWRGTKKKHLRSRRR